MGNTQTSVVYCSEKKKKHPSASLSDVSVCFSKHIFRGVLSIRLSFCLTKHNVYFHSCFHHSRQNLRKARSFQSFCFLFQPYKAELFYCKTETVRLRPLLSSFGLSLWSHLPKMEEVESETQQQKLILLLKVHR